MAFGVVVFRGSGGNVSLGGVVGHGGCSGVGGGVMEAVVVDIVVARRVF